MQVYYRDVWHWVCADQWDNQDADVACRMMDFDGSLSANSVYQKKKRTGVGMWLINMQCSGRESSLLMCGHNSSVGSHNCKGKREAGVKCKPKGNTYLSNGVCIPIKRSCQKSGPSCSKTDLRLTRVSFSCVQSKAFSRIVFSVIFRASNHQLVDKKNYN